MRDLRSPAPKARTALHVAARSGRAAVCTLLLELGMDPNVVSGDGRMPLHAASTPEICKILLDAGANIKVTSADGKDALYFALFPEAKGDIPNLDVVTFLLEHHADKKASFEEVRSLDMRNAYRDNLPVWIGQVAELAVVLVRAGNSLRSIPRNVVENGDAGVLEYLKDIACGAKDVWQGFKIMVLGKEGVGKTHIFHLASGKVYPRNASTDGIDIHTFKLGTEAQVPVTWFDFGGQEVFYPTHELFLTGQCVYLLAFKMEDPDYEKRVVYWLKVVATFSMDKAKVVIVGTHRDKLPRGDADVEVINKRINALTADSTTVVEKIYISCLDDAKVVGDLINNALLAAAQQAKLGGKEVPHIYTVIKDWAADQKARDKARPYFGWDAFVECFPGYDSYLLERACEFLHDMGVIFLAKRFVGNKKANLVCVDIQWLAKAFSAIITFRHNWVKEGVLRQEALSHIWRDFGIIDMQDMLAIMSLFEKFNIAFARRQDGVWIIPSMLIETEPALVNELWSRPLTHARLYRLSVVPSGAFGQIVARVSEWSDVLVPEMWRFGIVIRDESDFATLIVEGSEIHLKIFSAGALSALERDAIKKPLEGSGSLLRRLDEELQQIFKFVFRRMNTVPVETFILCPHCIKQGSPPEECNWLRYDDVVKLVLSGEPTFDCNGVNAPLEQIGEDLTLGYVQAFPASQVKIEKEALARGGFGMIFKGVMKNGAKIVVKELIMESGSEVSLFADFQREVSLMAQLHHENLVQMYGIMLSPLRMVLEFCGDGDLLGALRKGKVKDAALKLRLATDVAKGMHFLHSLTPPLAHRDLRSPNVLLMSLNIKSSAAVAKVADFGLTAAASSRLQQELLTWQWMAPEAFLGENYTETCDLYSYGMILWEIYTGTGEIPFESVAALDKNKKKQAREFMNDIIHKGLRPTCDPSFPEEMTATILQLWEKDPNSRPTFATCLEVLAGMQSGVKYGPGQLKVILNRDRSKIRALQVGEREDVPVMNLKCKPLPLSTTESIAIAACRPMVSGYKETVWVGGVNGGLLVSEVSGKKLFEQKKAHMGPVKVIQCSVADGSVWTGGADGIVVRWEVVLPAPVLLALAAISRNGSVIEEDSQNSRGSSSLHNSSNNNNSGSSSRGPNSPAVAHKKALPNNGGGGSWGVTASAVRPTAEKVQIGRRGAVSAEASAPVSPMGARASNKSAAKSQQLSAESSTALASAAAAAAGIGPAVSSSQMSLSTAQVMASVVPSFESTQPAEQPHKGAEVRAMLSIAKSGAMVTGDSKGQVVVWTREGAVAFKTRLEAGIVGFCAEDGETQIWVAEGASLHRVEVSARGVLKIAKTFAASHGSFAGMVFFGGHLWAADGPDVKIIDSSTDTVIKVLHLPAAKSISCISLVQAFGQPTVWCGANSQVSIWDVKTKTSIKTFVEKDGDVAFLTEVGENLVLTAFAGKLCLFDMNFME